MLKVVSRFYLAACQNDMFLLVAVASLFALVASFPNYIPCASDRATLLKVGTHTCSRAKGKKGSDITAAKVGEAKFVAQSTDGHRVSSVAPGETLELTLDANHLNPLLEQ